MLLAAKIIYEFITLARFSAPPPYGGENRMKEHICMCRRPQDICIRLMSGDLIKSITDHLTTIAKELCTAVTGPAFFIYTDALLSR